MRWVWLFVLLSACSKPAEPGSCSQVLANTCIQYPAERAAAGKRLCAGLTWRPGDKTCPTIDWLGTCAKSSGDEQLYAGAPNHYTPASARAVCERGGGTFAPALPTPDASTSAP